MARYERGMEIRSDTPIDAESDALARQVAEQLIAKEGTAPAWGLILEEARAGYARVRMKVRADMLNGHGTAHGGMIFALADSAFAYACNSHNRAAMAQGASILFLGPAQVGEDLIAEARETALAGRSGSYTIEVRAGDGRIVAQLQCLSRTVGGPIVTNEEDDHG
ncbi:MAG: phenylacetic acid degradation protein PaaD [Sphingomonas bacterium]|uniref:hydroxyphenylacetyl-CoA thioesterase PaaI n=1 Tax=Sphingomonas bacterium TaxID=1895847 RepID=UPI00262438AF|nr:hydroxyphenylacetyl-CoA thioesterase PaaI [Sphingomonas bacterium]MDB5710408.1 phenylacetic acid degradation protein PaaD [Sphingomonas bacterium]